MRLINPMYLANSYGEIIKNFSRLQFNSTSVDITASTIAFTENTPDLTNINSFIIDIKNKQPLHLVQSQEMLENGCILIPPNSSVIIETNESFNIPLDVCAMYQSVGNLNISNIASLSNIWIKPEWKGNLRITLHNYNKMHSYKLYENQPIGQLVFFNIHDNEKYQFEWN